MVGDNFLYLSFWIYAKKINDKIESMLTAHAKINFLAQIDSRKIFTKPAFKKPGNPKPALILSDKAKNKNFFSGCVGNFGGGRNEFENRVGVLNSIVDRKCGAVG